eukprot:366549-Chlamydomonas_euryale.AAC.1
MGAITVHTTVHVDHGDQKTPWRVPTRARRLGSMCCRLGAQAGEHVLPSGRAGWGACAAVWARSATARTHAHTYKRGAGGNNAPRRRPCATTLALLHNPYMHAHAHAQTHPCALENTLTCGVRVGAQAAELTAQIDSLYGDCFEGVRVPAAGGEAEELDVGAVRAQPAETERTVRGLLHRCDGGQCCEGTASRDRGDGEGTAAQT